MQSVPRSVCLVAAAHDIELKYQHVPGILNTQADALSHAFDPFCDLDKLHDLENHNWWPFSWLWCYPIALL